MIVVGFPGDDVDDKGVKALREEIAGGRLGGVMYLKTNVASLDAVQGDERGVPRGVARPAAVHHARPGGRRGRAADRGRRLQGNSQRSDRRREQYARARPRRSMRGMARKDRRAGASRVNFGPVADLNVNPNNQVIAKFGRAFGKTADTVAAYAEAFIAAHHAAGLLTSLKHFPGHGSSHRRQPRGLRRHHRDLERERARAVSGADRRWLRGLRHGRPPRSHRLCRCGRPGCRRACRRNGSTACCAGELGFKGVVISDDLEMGAIREHFDLKETVTTAVRGRRRRAAVLQHRQAPSRGSATKSARSSSPRPKPIRRSRRGSRRATSASWRSRRGSAG